MRRVRRNITLFEDLDAELDRLVAEEDVIASRIVERALREYFARPRSRRRYADHHTRANTPVCTDDASSANVLDVQDVDYSQHGR